MRVFRVLPLLLLRRIGGTELSMLPLDNGLSEDGWQVDVTRTPRPLLDESASGVVAVLEAGLRRTVRSLLKDGSAKFECLSVSQTEAIRRYCASDFGTIR